MAVFNSNSFAALLAPEINLNRVTTRCFTGITAQLFVNYPIGAGHLHYILHVVSCRAFSDIVVNHPAAAAMQCCQPLQSAASAASNEPAALACVAFSGSSCSVTPPVLTDSTLLYTIKGIQLLARSASQPVLPRQIGSSSCCSTDATHQRGRRERPSQFKRLRRVSSD